VAPQPDHARKARPLSARSAPGRAGRAEPAVAIRDLRVRRGAKLVLPGLSLQIEAGTVTGLLGPSGCGKSTLMRSIVGVQHIESGTVEVLGAAAGTPAQRRRVAYVTQAPSVYSDLTVRENLRYFSRIIGAPAGRSAAVVGLVGLEGHVDERLDTLSGGERSRASLAVALLNKPALLVLDEPTVGLDPLLRRELWETFHRLAADGATLLVSSHVMDEADRCDVLVLMREGCVIANGTPDEVRERGGSVRLEDAFIALAGDSR
jgi:ABC-2 type transport system ATP-binding protein